MEKEISEKKLDTSGPTTKNVSDRSIQPHSFGIH